MKRAIIVLSLLAVLAGCDDDDDSGKGQIDMNAPHVVHIDKKPFILVPAPDKNKMVIVLLAVAAVAAYRRLA